MRVKPDGFDHYSMMIRKKLFLTAGMLALLGAVLIVTTIFLTWTVRSFIVTGLGLLLIFFIISMSLLFVWRITRDIHTLVQGTREMGRGRLDHRIPLPGEDEVGILARAFNTMADNLQELVRKDRSSLARLSEEMAQTEQAREALRLSEEKFRNIFQHHSAVKLIIDPGTGSIIEANEAAEKFYGWSVAELKQMRIQEINMLSPEEIHAEMESARALKRIYFEFRHRLADDSIRDVGVYSSKIEIDGKAFLHSIIHDITERRTAEKELAESHDLLDNLARMVPGVIYQYRLYPDGRSMFPYASPGMNDIYEVTPEEVREDASSIFGRLHPDDHDRVAGAISESARTLETFYCEFRVILPRQGLCWRWSQAQPQKLQDDSTLWHGIILDVTDRKLSEEERGGLQTQLIQAQKMEAIGALAGGIAHDFNNILFPIIGYTEILMGKSPEDSDSQSSLNEILSASMRARELVQQILTFSRQSQKEPRPVKMQFIVREVLQLVKASIPSNITIRQHIDKNCGMVLADPTNIHQIAMNLITNAYHAMESAENGTLTIQLSQVNLSADDAGHGDLKPGMFACFSVSDTGQGIEKTVLERIFEPYFTTKPEGKGTGLGLSVVHGIVKSYHGDIRVKSETGKGSTFQVYLPVIDSRQEKEIIMDRLSIPGGSEHILLVDDELQILKMEKQMLESLGYRITMSTGSKEALEVFRLSSDRFDLVITDMTMPHMSGEKLAMEIRNIRQEIPVIICTGFSEKISPEKARKLGIDGFLFKPIIKSDLAKTIRAALDGKRRHT